MKHLDPTHHRGNPFSTRWIRPGAIPFFFPPGESVDALIERLKQNRWRGAIVGRHGSGKSSLVAALLPRLKECGMRPSLATLHDGQRSLPKGFLGRAEPDSKALLIIDGFEQLGVWARMRLYFFRWRTRCGLLVTSHAPTALPEVCRTDIDIALARRIVAHLDPLDAGTIATDLAARLEAHEENMRDVLFELYDRYEQRRQDLS